MTFQTSEQGFMYSKALLFGDHEIAKKILNAKTPKEAKAYGRKVRNFDEVVWKQQRIILMTNNLYAKFSQNQHLKDSLLAVHEDHFVEASPTDNIWGIGLNEATAKTLLPSQWQGQNLLGKVLDNVRDRLKREV